MLGTYRQVCVHNRTTEWAGTLLMKNRCVCVCVWDYKRGQVDIYVAMETHL